MYQVSRYYNPKQMEPAELMKIKMVKDSGPLDNSRLYEQSAGLFGQINPTRSAGTDKQDVMMQCLRQALEEIEHM